MSQENQAGSKISLEEAQQLIKNYQDSQAAVPGHLNSLLVSADLIRGIIDQPGCQYVRLYMAKKNDEKSLGVDQSFTIVAVGTDADGTDMDKEGEIVDNMQACPPHC